MKKYFSSVLGVITAVNLFAQTWTPAQLAKANTAKNITYLSKVEKEAIMYINLARLFPSDFIRNELVVSAGMNKGFFKMKNDRGPYQTTLVATLRKMKPVKALLFDKKLFETAKCFAKEQGASGATGHSRKKCQYGGYDAECCSYGQYTGIDVALQLLIDRGVPSLGHREICLDPYYAKIGLSLHPHKQYGTCAVLDFMR